MIFVRYAWSQITKNSAHFEQSFSDDGGKTWEVNWITDQTRVGSDRTKGIEVQESHHKADFAPSPPLATSARDTKDTEVRNGRVFLCLLSASSAPAVTYFDRWSKSRLHHQLVREYLLVRKESQWATGLMVLGMTAFLVACEHERPRASKTGSTDANQAFAEYAARANASPTTSTGNVSSRGGTGFPGGGGARGGGNQSGF
jgi:hypothetical protein